MILKLCFPKWLSCILILTIITQLHGHFNYESRKKLVIPEPKVTNTNSSNKIIKLKFPVNFTFDPFNPDNDKKVDEMLEKFRSKAKKDIHETLIEEEDINKIRLHKKDSKKFENNGNASDMTFKTSEIEGSLKKDSEIKNKLKLATMKSTKCTLTNTLPTLDPAFVPPDSDGEMNNKPTEVEMFNKEHLKQTIVKRDPRLYRGPTTGLMPRFYIDDE